MQYTKENIRRAILETALEEFYEKGYEEASMRAIAQGAGTSLGNLYHYFRNKDDLYVSCLMPVLEEGISWIGKIFDVSKEALAFTASHMVAFIQLHQREYTLIAKGPACHYAAFQAKFTACVAQRLKAHVAESQDSASFPLFYDALAAAFCSGLREILERSGDPDRTGDQVLELMRFLFENFDERVGSLRKEA